MKFDLNKIKTRAKTEFSQLFLITIYLTILFGTLTTYKRSILAVHGIDFAEYGYSLISAWVMAKVLMIGNAFRIGSRFNDRPLIIPALYKAICFSFLVLALAVIEKFIRGWWAGKSTSTILEACAGPEMWGILARVMMLFFVLIPFFFFWETNRVMGGDVLGKLFFKPGIASDVKGIHF
jgi:hypothetical protein